MEWGFLLMDSLIALLILYIAARIIVTMVKVHQKKGSIYVFLTKFGPIKGILERSDNENDLRNHIYKLLEMGIDGLMTDYPKKISQILRNEKSISDF